MNASALHPVVVVGAAQHVQREVELAESLDPLTLLCRVARQAAADAQVGDALLESLDTICLVDAMGWHPSNAPDLLAEALGARRAKLVSAATGGETGLSLLNRAAAHIAQGQSRTAFVGGVHMLKTLYAARRARVQLSWPKGGRGVPELWSAHRPGESELERLHGLKQPTELYPLVENALRARRRHGLQAHRAALGRLFSPMTRVAAQNPYAWFPVERSAEELCDVSARNRMIAYPYTKYLNAVMETDQAAGVLIMSLEAAQAAGIPRDRCMYWLGGEYVEERAWHVSERADLSRSVALEACAKQLLERTAISMSDIDFIDFYSCFPIAVELACEAYGVAEEDPRGLTVTGGLPYAGGPGNNYTLHAVAAMLERLRARPGSFGLCTGNGWYLTKHAATLFGTNQPTPQLMAASLLPASRSAGEAPLMPTGKAQGRGRVEAYTVTYDREGAPERGIVIGRLDSGARFVANAGAGRAQLEAMVERELCGVQGSVRIDDKGVGSFALD
jgi:acetyl-CoA C-acetyltransferase